MTALMNLSSVTSNTSLERSVTCDDEWLQFCSNNYQYEEAETKVVESNIEPNKSKNVEFIDLQNDDTSIPKSTELYISTKTKIGYFEKELDIANIFWKIDVIPYQQISKGIIKKQMKIATNDEKYIAFVDSVVASTPNCELLDLSKGKNKYVKKISIGTSKKDLVSYRTKKKSAFYNCFVLYFRIHTDEGFKEMHVKIFNTGKIEIPGIKNDYLMNIVLSEIDELFNAKLGLNNSIKRETFTTVLINSNFNCGYYVNREKLVDILKGKYCLSTSYDPCSYPGIMSKFYYNKDIGSVENINVNYVNQAHTEGSNVLSFMIFRTGSILIVGKCNETILYKIYDFIKNILATEYASVSQNKLSDLNDGQSEKSGDQVIKKKIKKMHILVNC